ncbi:MAG TPA: hypothetical protein VK498_02910, partial [Ferruginibacter sp.]|nr:hypothetical protein [Ferruginibacter sp.]
MKKIILPVACFLSAFVGMAQKINNTAVPGQVKKVFMRIYPNTKVSWEKEEGNYEANFLRSG